MGREGPCSSSSTTWTWSWTFPSASSSSIMARRSPRARPRRSAVTRRSSRPTLGDDRTRGEGGERTGEALLHLDAVHAGYGEIEVLRGVSANVRADEIVSIIGALGAGKSTLLRTVIVMVKPTRGTIRLAGEENGG